MPVLPLFVAVVLGIAAAMLMSSGGNNSLIPATSGQRLESALNDVESAVSTGDCKQTQRALARLRSAWVKLPESVDDELQARLRQGIEHLQKIAPQECAEQEMQTEPEPEPEPTGDETVAISLADIAALREDDSAAEASTAGGPVDRAAEQDDEVADREKTTQALPVRPGQHA